MRLVHRKGFAVVYWMIGFLLTVVGIVVGMRIGSGQAPEIGDSTTGATAGSHLLFGIGGALLGGLLVLAIFAGMWIALWAAERRAHPEEDDRSDYDTLDDLEEDFEEDPDDGEPRPTR